MSDLMRHEPLFVRHPLFARWIYPRVSAAATE